MKKVSLAIVGATGMVGRTLLKVLEERYFPVEDVRFFASEEDMDQKVFFLGKTYDMEMLTEESFDRKVDIALFSASEEVSEKYAPIARGKGVVVIDNSDAWRMEDSVPLIVPEVNPDMVERHIGIISNPNCSTIQVVVPLKALQDAYGLKRVVFTTFQAVSGSGVNGLKELEKTQNGEMHHLYPHPIADNCIPHVGAFLENGYTKEEMSMIEETRKILNLPELKITATCVRVPIKHGHSISVNVELERDFTVEGVKRLMDEYPGIILVDDPEIDAYPTVLKANGMDGICVGRIRRDPSLTNGLNLWIVADNVRKGAATNAIQIAELLIKKDVL
jgi:aspartate-semialdehyde dehydrogenase